MKILWSSLIEYSKESTKQLLKLISELSKTAEYKIDVKNLENKLLFLSPICGYMNSGIYWDTQTHTHTHTYISLPKWGNKQRKMITQNPENKRSPKESKTQAEKSKNKLIRYMAINAKRTSFKKKTQKLP